MMQPIEHTAQALYEHLAAAALVLVISCRNDRTKEALGEAMGAAGGLQLAAAVGWLERLKKDEELQNGVVVSSPGNNMHAFAAKLDLV